MSLPRAGVLLAEKHRPIFVGGIHGVGKSTVLSEVCAELGIPHITASDVIRQFKSKNSIEHIDRGKRVGNISENQDILVSALNDSTIRSSSFVLDGHFTLLNSSEVVQPVPIETFSSINPLVLFVLIDDPELIRSRLLLRDKEVYCSKKLGMMQDREVEHAQKVAKHLGVQLHKVSPLSAVHIKEIINDFN